MSSASYIPLSQIPPSEWPVKQPSRLSLLRAYFSHRRTVNALVAATSIITLLVFVKYSLSHDDLETVKLDLSHETDASAEPVPQVVHQSNYIAIPVSDALPPQAQPKLRPVRDLPRTCLEQYYAAGQPCHDGQGPLPFDVVWTWANGSDPLFSDAKDALAKSYAQDDPYRPRSSNNPARMYRDHDELRHSIRSVLTNFRPYINHFRILTSDLEYPHNANQSFPDPGPGRWRLGLQPQWLETAKSGNTEWRDGDVHLSLTHHAHFFEPYKHSVFNSYAIESQFGHLQDISESFIYFNDDFFMVAPLTPTSFYTHQFGTVLRIQSSLTVSPDLPGPNTVGEWRSMGMSNYLLSKRFGRRARPYIQHLAKSVSHALLQEISLIWADVVAATGTHAFRETAAGDGDFYQLFVFNHFIVERAREALLWTWVVGRIGALDDSWGADEDTRAWIELGGGRASEIKVESGERDTLNQELVKEYLAQGGVSKDGSTEYHFSSLDGYAYNPFGRRGREGWPGFDPTDADPKSPSERVERAKRMCTIKRDECFAIKDPNGGAPRASDIFKHVAFDRTECGDCIIHALVRASGPLGLSAFLPDPERRSPATGGPLDIDAVPHLPLVDDWHNGEFALRSAMHLAPGTSVREWSMRLMQRYRYVIGGTPSAFEPLRSFDQTRSMLAKLDKNKELALLCVNDEVNRDHDRITTYFRKWQDQRWGQPAAWEADVASHSHRRREEGEERDGFRIRGASPS